MGHMYALLLLYEKQNILSLYINGQLYAYKTVLSFLTAYLLRLKTLKYQNIPKSKSLLNNL